MVLWDVTPCRLVDIYQHFRGTCCLYLHGSSQHIPPVGPIYKIKLHHVLKDSNHTTHCHEILIPHTRKVTLILFYSCFVMPTYLRTKHKATILRFWGKEFHAGCYTPIAVTIKGTFFSDVMARSLVQIYWGLEEPTTCTPMMKSVGSPAIAINFYQFRGPCIIIYSYNRTNEMH